MELAIELDQAKMDIIQLLHRELDDLGDTLEDIEIQMRMLTQKRTEYLMQERGIVKQINNLIDDK